MSLFNFDDSIQTFSDFKVKLDYSQSGRKYKEINQFSPFLNLKSVNFSHSPGFNTFDNPGATPRFSFTTLGLSHRKSVKSLIDSDYVMDGFDEIITSAEGLDESFKESEELFSFLNHLNINEDDDCDQINNQEALWNMNEFISSPIFKQCIAQSKYRKNLILTPIESPLIHRLKNEERKNSKSKNAVENLIKIGRKIMNGEFKNEGGIFEDFLYNVLHEMCFLNERSIILKMVDKSSSKLTGGMNDKYLTAYNAFRLPVTFTDIQMLKFYKDQIHNWSGRHLFDDQKYWLRSSTTSHFHMHEVDQSTRFLRNEILILSKIKHPNLIRYFSSWFEYQVLFEQLEYAPGGNLDEFIRNNLRRHNRIFNIFSTEGGTRKISNHSGLTLISQISLALDYLQRSFKLIHSNISTFNIMIFLDGSEVSMEQIEKAIQGNGPVHFKLAGFERCVEILYLKPFNKDLLDLAVVALRALLGAPSCSFDDLWSRVYPIDSWCHHKVLCQVLKSIIEETVVSPDKLLRLIISLQGADKE